MFEEHLEIRDTKTEKEFDAYKETSGELCLVLDFMDKESFKPRMSMTLTKKQALILTEWLKRIYKGSTDGKESLSDQT